MTLAEVRSAADSLRVLADAVRDGQVEATTRQHTALLAMVGALEVVTAEGGPETM